jgi:hypothetical protein
MKEENDRPSNIGYAASDATTLLAPREFERQPLGPEDVCLSVLSGGTWRSRSRASPSESAENLRIDCVLEANVGQGD